MIRPQKYLFKEMQTLQNRNTKSYFKFKSYCIYQIKILEKE